MQCERPFRFRGSRCFSPNWLNAKMSTHFTIIALLDQQWTTICLNQNQTSRQSNVRQNVILHYFCCCCPLSECQFEFQFGSAINNRNKNKNDAVRLIGFDLLSAHTLLYNNTKINCISFRFPHTLTVKSSHIKWVRNANEKWKLMRTMFKMHLSGILLNKTHRSTWELP